MISLRRHSGNDYAELPNIDLPNVGSLNEGDKHCLGEIGEYLLDARVNKRFSVGLLHSHFPIEDDELLVEEIRPVEQAIVLRPKQVAPSNLVATAVRFEGTAASPGPLRLVALEFAPLQALTGTLPIGHGDSEALTNLAGILYRHERAARFGIRLIHDLLKLDGCILLETCDPTNRALICEIAAESDPAIEQSIATVFSWQDTPLGAERLTSQGCMQFCKSIQRCNLDRDGNHRKGPSSHEQSHE